MKTQCVLQCHTNIVVIYPVQFRNKKLANLTCVTPKVLAVGGKTNKSNRDSPGPIIASYYPQLRRLIGIMNIEYTRLNCMIKGCQTDDDDGGGGGGGGVTWCCCED